MASVINSMFRDITWPEMHCEQKILHFVRNLYATKMQSFINLGRKGFLFFDVNFFPIKSSEVKGQGAKWKPRYDFLS